MIAKIFDFYDLGIFETLVSEDDKFGEGEMIVFKDEEATEAMGKILGFLEKKSDKEPYKEGFKIVRKATAHDSQKFEANKERGENAISTCNSLVNKYLLNMYPFYACYSLDGAKLNIVFTADDRVDFRDLVKDLAKSLQKQIHLKQIGPRDKAKIVGGFGRCGRPLCCKGILSNLESVTMEMVRVQSLEGKGSAKLSGACGKLLCCLKYEAEAYKEFRSGLPAIGSTVKLKKPVLGAHEEGIVVALDILNKKVKVNVGNRDWITVDASAIGKVLKKPLDTSPRGRYVREEVVVNGEEGVGDNGEIEKDEGKIEGESVKVEKAAGSDVGAENTAVGKESGEPSKKEAVKKDGETKEVEKVSVADGEKSSEKSTAKTSNPKK